MNQKSQLNRQFPKANKIRKLPQKAQNQKKLHPLQQKVLRNKNRDNSPNLHFNSQMSKKKIKRKKIKRMKSLEIQNFPRFPRTRMK
jgi:hypothetical protein